MAAGASSGSSNRDAKSVSTRKFTFTRPIVSVTGSIRTSTRLTAGSRQSTTIVSRPSRRRSQDRQEQLDERADDDDAGVQVELALSSSTCGTPSSSPTMITTFQATGARAGGRNGGTC